MLYCESCGFLYDESAKCPICRKNKGRPPREEDPCFLTEKGQIESDMLEDVLRQNGVLCMKKSVSGAGIAMFTGLLLEKFRLFVPYAELEKARNIADELLGGPPVDWEAEEGEEEDEPDDDQE